MIPRLEEFRARARIAKDISLVPGGPGGSRKPVVASPEIERAPHKLLRFP
jgi:hypothetical protein